MSEVVLISKCGRTGGVPRYGRELRNRIDILQHYKYNCSDIVGESNTTELVTGSSLLDRIRGKVWDAPKALKESEAKLYHALDPTEFVVARVASSVSVIVTLHDLVAYKHRSYMNDPPHNVLKSRLYLRLLSQSDAHIVTVSESTKKDAVDLLGIDPSRINVVYPGIDDMFRPIPSDNLSVELLEPSILMVGDMRDRKNHKNVIKSLQYLNENENSVHLYVVGPDTESAKLKEISKRHNVWEYVHPTGWISDDELVEYYNAANVFIMPSFYEGFGFPVGEAMACGTPVITSDVSSLPEVGGKAVEYVSPSSPEEITSSIEKLISSPGLRDKMREQGIEQASNFTWEETTKQIKGIYQQILQN